MNRFNEWFKRSAVGRFFFDTYLSNEVKEEVSAILSLSRKDPWKDALDDSEKRMLEAICGTIPLVEPDPEPAAEPAILYAERLEDYTLVRKLKIYAMPEEEEEEEEEEIWGEVSRGSPGTREASHEPGQSARRESGSLDRAAVHSRGLGARNPAPQREE